ncbi:MAG TPA: hypothetical protein VFJ97_04165 [Dermatophilaceae bacterium]|nr:hypothetical protein [Dermatophilaceae bacterium]
MVRLLRPVSDPLGSYLRVGGKDHTFLAQMLVDGKALGGGLVADPARLDEHKDLWLEARQQGVQTVLDPRSLELSTPGGIRRGGARSLAWAPSTPNGLHTPDSLYGRAGEDLCDQLVDMVVTAGHTAVLAPTHFLASARDAWLDVDADLTCALRGALDRVGLQAVPIYYPLITKSENFNDPNWRTAVARLLRPLPIDAIWLRIHPFGTATAGPLALKRYLAACRDLHKLERPLVGEHTGAVGVALMAFGALGGVESGITVNDHTNLTDWLKVPTKTGGGGGEARIYLHQLGTFLDRSKAIALLNRPGMKAAHACLDTACCPRGWRDTQLRYREHFVTQRDREVNALSAIPEPLRAGNYLENFLRPASDKAVRAAEVEPALLSTRKRLDSWRGTLGNDLTTTPVHSFSPPAAGKRHRKSA